MSSPWMRPSAKAQMTFQNPKFQGGPSEHPGGFYNLHEEPTYTLGDAYTTGTPFTLAMHDLGVEM